MDDKEVRAHRGARIRERGQGKFAVRMVCNLQFANYAYFRFPQFFNCKSEVKEDYGETPVLTFNGTNLKLCLASPLRATWGF